MRIHIRVTPRQKERIRNKAKKLSLTMTEYLLKVSLYRAPPIPQQELDKLRYRLDRDGRELNGWVKWINGYAVLDGSEEAIIRDIWRSIRRSLDDAFAWLDTPQIQPPADPALTIGQTKSDDLAIRVTADQRQRIRAKAARSGMTVTRFLVTAALKRIPPYRKCSAEQTYIALMRIGNNMTQAKRYLDTHWGITGEEYRWLDDEFLAEAARFRRAMGWDYKLELEEG